LINSSQETVAVDLMQADIFCGHAKVPVDWKSVVEANRLKWIQSSAAGLDHCLVPEVIDSQIIVSGCSGLFANQVAEQAMALLFAAVRRLPTYLRAQQSRQFRRRETDDLHGKSMLIVGFGGNGRRIAELLQPIAARILATDVFPDYQIPDYVDCRPCEQLDQLIGQAEVVIITLPLNDRTRYCFGRDQFSCMRQGTYFINVARGAVVDQDALIQALDDGQVCVAGLDVVDPEPLPNDSPLWSRENVIITPHVGAQSHLRESITTELFCLNLARFRDGQRLVNLVDKTLQFPHPQDRPHVDRMGKLKIASHSMRDLISGTTASTSRTPK
jgi:D-3-phosphoglycerate dehydrogenase